MKIEVGKEIRVSVSGVILDVDQWDNFTLEADNGDTFFLNPNDVDIEEV